MSQDLISISQEMFQMQLYKMSVSNLKDIAVRIVKLNKERAMKLQDEDICRDYQILDLERKLSKILSEFQRRKVTVKGNDHGLNDWLFKHHDKKYY